MTMITGAIQHVVRRADAVLGRLYLAFFRERGAVLTCLFHSLFRDEREIAMNVVDPLERTVLRLFQSLVEYLLLHGYQFITPADVVRGLAPGGKYAMLTFDDGYYNNSLALPVLERLRVPATFFISTDHVRRNKCFWWDVLFRERRAQGASPGRIYREAVSFKRLTTDQIETRLATRFGRDAFRPRGDVDRPFSPDELARFARSPYVHLGNHTANHAILTNYAPDQARRQILDAQRWLEAITGVRPCAIAYPNGAYNAQIVQACAQLGLKIGFTTRPGKSAVPPGGSSPDMFRFGRFVPTGREPIEAQCRAYRSDFRMYGLLRSCYLLLARRQLGS
jgi:peptidoglycan/xylan/chitin deacetylase (PgdA/CDA1 family)